MGKIDAILIAGPTASGKSAFALKQAIERNGAVINADSMQVYRELRILTARPDKEDEAKAPHKLYGTVSGADPYSVGHWYEEVKLILQECENSSLLPIFTGGAGLYFFALLKGLSPVPPIPEEVRMFWREKAVSEGGPALYEELMVRDPEMGRTLRPSDPQRLARALEVLDATGISLAEWRKKPGKPLLIEENIEKYVICPDRKLLYERCDARFDKMLEQGVLEEVKALSDLNIDKDLPIMRALGVKPLQQYLEGELSLQEAADLTKRDTRRYAKRQLTWLRSNMISWNRV